MNDVERRKIQTSLFSFVEIVLKALGFRVVCWGFFCLWFGGLLIFVWVWFGFFFFSAWLVFG